METIMIAAGLRPKTIQGSKLTPVRTILQWGVQNKLISSNAGDGISVDLWAQVHAQLDRDTQCGQKPCTSIPQSAERAITHPTSPSVCDRLNRIGIIPRVSSSGRPRGRSCKAQLARIRVYIASEREPQEAVTENEQVAVEIRREARCAGAFDII
jgi:hypothetical protein